MAFSSLNLLLQTQALLSSINYLTTIIPSDDQRSDTKEVQISDEKQQKNLALQKGMENILFLVNKHVRILEVNGES